MRPLSRHRCARLLIKVGLFLAPILAVLLGCAAAQLPQRSSLSNAAGAHVARVSLSAASVDTPTPSAASPAGASPLGTIVIVVIVAALVIVAFWRVLLRLLLVAVVAGLAFGLIMLGVGLSTVTHEMSTHPTSPTVANTVLNEADTGPPLFSRPAWSSRT